MEPLCSVSIPGVSSSDVSTTRASPVGDHPFFSFAMSFVARETFSFYSLIMVAIPPFFVVPRFSTTVFSAISPDVFM